MLRYTARPKKTKQTDEMAMPTKIETSGGNQHMIFTQEPFAKARTSQKKKGWVPNNNGSARVTEHLAHLPIQFDPNSIRYRT